MDRPGTDEPPTPRSGPPLALDLGSVLASAATLWVRHLPAVTATSIVLHAPLLLWGAAIERDGPTGPQLRRLYLACVFSNILFRAWLAGGLARSVADEGAPRRFSALRCIGQALRGTWTTLLLCLRVAGQAFLVSMLLGALYQGVARGDPAATRPGADPLTFSFSGAQWLAVILWFGVFGFFLWAVARAFVAVPIARVEGRRVGRAFADSLHRTSGLRGRIVGAILLWLVLQLTAAWLPRWFGAGLPPSFFLWTWLGWDVLVSTPLFALLMCVVDRDLRRGALGPRPGTLERVFE